MNPHRALAALVLAAACYPAIAEDTSDTKPTMILGALDTYFEAGRQPTGGWMCGFMVRGNHRSHDDPHTEWDMHIVELRVGDTEAAGVSAATFQVSHHKRTLRAPIAAMSFSIPGDPAVVPVEIRAVPSGDDSVRGEIALDDAHRLLTAMANESRVTAQLRYADQTSERIEIMTGRYGAGGKNSTFENCKRGLLPFYNVRMPTP
jgi:hypothetical protein